MATPASLSRGSLLLGCLAALLSRPGLARAAGTTKTLVRRFDVAPFTVPRTRAATKVLLNVAPVQSRLVAAATSPQTTLLLRLGGLRVPRPPGIVWRVYLDRPGTSSRKRRDYYVGTVALFSEGVGPATRPATDEFAIDEAILRSLPFVTGTLELGFVPTGPLVDGRRTSPRPAAAMRVAELSIWAQHL